VAAICHKSWGPAPHLSPSINPPFFPSLLWTLQGVCPEPAHPLPNILMQFMQSNSLIKSTLMFNVFLMYGLLQNHHAEFSHSRQNWYLILWITGTKKWGSVHTWTPTAKKWGVRTPGLPKDHSPPLTTGLVSDTRYAWLTYKAPSPWDKIIHKVSFKKNKSSTNSNIFTRRHHFH